MASYGPRETDRPIAVVLDGPRPRAWQRHVLDALLSSPHVDVVETRLIPHGGPRWSWLWRLHRRIERAIFGGAADPFERVAAPAAENSSSRPAELLLWLAHRPPTAEERDAAGTPVAWLSHDGGRAPDAFGAAVLHSSPGVESEVLLARPGEPTPLVVARTTSGVRPFSLWVTSGPAAWKCAALLVRVAERGELEPLPASARTDPEGAPRPPGAARLLAVSLARWARIAVHRVLWRRPWEVIVRTRGADGEPWDRARTPVAWAPGHMYADPFLFEHEGRHHLFCEEVEPGSGRGVISHVELVPAGPLAVPGPVLRGPHHLSYPFVFAHDGRVFMVPETSAARRVELYRATDFPLEWTLEAVLLDDLDAADATILEHEGRLWMFVAIAPHGGSLLDELHVYWARTPAGPWTPHAHTPVFSDARAARPAGPVLHEDGRLLRPAQDGSRRYGGAVSFRAIDLLTPDEYAEHEVRRLEPAAVSGARALHTYSRDRRYEAIDVRRRVLRAWPRRLTRRRG